MQKQPVYAGVKDRQNVSTYSEQVSSKTQKKGAPHESASARSRFKLFSLIQITVLFMDALHREVVLRWPLFVGNFLSAKMSFYTDQIVGVLRWSYQRAALYLSSKIASEVQKSSADAETR